MRLIRDSRGVFTLEASLVFPMLFYTVLILLFFCLYLYQSTLLGQAAAIAAERSAYTWDNSQRDDVTGAYVENKYDSLYWRLKDDGMLQIIFGWSGQNGSEQISLPSNEAFSGSLPQQKLARTGGKLPSSMQGAMRYDNQLLLRKVTVVLERIVPLRPLERWMGEAKQSARSDAYVVEPVEWIRTVNLARYYGAKFTGRAKGQRMDKQEAGNALKLFGK